VYGDHLIAQLLFTTVVVFLFIGSLLGLAIGIGLLLRSSAVLRFMDSMNRWVSTRQAFDPLEQVPVRSGPSASSGRWFGAVLVVLGAYSSVILIANIDIERLAALLKIDARYSLTAIGLQTAKWTLVAGSVGAVIAGIMLLFFPQAWRNVESRANRWHSTRNLEISGDTVYMSLDRVVKAFPRASGVVIFVMSFVTTVASGSLLF
jgi:hypothetical protein